MHHGLARLDCDDRVPSSSSLSMRVCFRLHYRMEDDRTHYNNRRPGCTFASMRLGREQHDGSRQTPAKKILPGQLTRKKRGFLIFRRV